MLKLRILVLRGFTLEELKAAGISKGLAQTIGIAVDFRRRYVVLYLIVANIVHFKSFAEPLLLLGGQIRSAPGQCFGYGSA